MKFSEKWLREWVNPNLTTQELVQQLTMAGLEVDSSEPVAADFTEVMTAEILSVEPHPNADRLRLCLVNTGERQLTIVCGAPNVRPGLKVALAVIGAKLPNNITIKRSKIRGIESEGMICSAVELGLAETSNGTIIELPNDAPVGVNFRNYLQLDDHVIDVDLTPNRGDCLSIVGLAREIAVLNACEFNLPESLVVPATITDTLPISIDALEAAPRYLGRVIRNINNTVTSPIWLTERLRRSGIRAINPVVDVLNYVMLELGQPLHAFDYTKINDKIIVRFAKPDEKVKLLNGQEVTLRSNTLIIADSNNPLAIAGVMGGEATSVTPQSTDIFIESAFFTPSIIAGRARQYGLHTDASYRYERGVDPELPRRAIERVTSLLTEIVAGQPGPIIDKTADAYMPKASRICLAKAKVARYLGLSILDEKIEIILKQLHMMLECVDQCWYITPPTYRFDIKYDVDLIEEIARIYGYQNIPVATPLMPLSSQQPSEKSVTLNAIRNCLVGSGYQEAITYSFVDAKLQQMFDPDAVPMTLSNPISYEMAVMRTTLWPSLLAAVLYNQRRQQMRVRLFEIGQRFYKRGEELVQEYVLAGVATGSRYPEQWGESLHPVDFYDVKADIEALLRLTRRGKDFMFEATEHPALLPGQTARIMSNGEVIGCVGAIHPKIMQSLECEGPIFLFEVQLASIAEAVVPKFTSLSKYPSIRRDIAIVIDRSVTAQSVEAVIKRVTDKLLADIVVFDVYDGKGIPAGKKSFAVGLTLQHQNRTLVDEEVNQVLANVIGELQDKFNAILRE